MQIDQLTSEWKKVNAFDHRDPMVPHDIQKSIRRMTCSMEFYSFLRSRFPVTSDFQWNLLLFLLFSRERVFSQGIAAGLAGYKTVPMKFSAIALLKDFNDNIQQITWKDADHLQKKARVIDEVDWTDDVRVELAKEMRREFWNIGRVYLKDGSIFTRKKQLTKMKDELDYIDQMRAENPVARELIAYLNHLPPQTFLPLLNNASTALQGVIKHEDTEQQWKLFKSVMDKAVPFYKQGENTSRIYEIGGGLSNLDRELRKQFTHGWFEADLKNAQLAIAAKLWNISSIEAFLETGKSFWEYLYAELGTTDEHKDVLKKVLYAHLYGGNGDTPWIKGATVTVEEKLAEIGITYADFRKLPLIKDLLKARGRKQTEIRNAGGEVDAFGTFITGKPHVVAAIVMQSYEMKLLEPIVAEALKKKSHGFTITLWQHDGFTFEPTHSTRAGETIQKMAQMVAEVAGKYGFVTRLEVVKN